MLTMSDPQTSIAVGKWVRVCKGTYKGDVGYVSAVEGWGGASLLLVPCLAPPCLPGTSSSKRKCSNPLPVPELFDPLTARRKYGWDLGTNVDTYGYIWICSRGYRYSMDTGTTISG